MKNPHIRHIPFIVAAILLFVVMFTVNSQLARASLAMNSLMDAFDTAEAAWIESRMLITLDTNLNEEQQNRISGNLSEIIRFLSSPEIVRLTVFTNIAESTDQLESDFETLIDYLPIQYKTVDSLLVDRIEQEMLNTRTTLRNYSGSLNNGFTHLVQAQVILIFILIVFIIIAMFDRSRQRLKMDLDRRFQDEISRAREREHHHIALEIHDDIVPELSRLRLNLGLEAEHSEERVVLDKLLVRLRDLSKNLRWPDFSSEPFIPSVRDMIELTERRSAVTVNFVSGGINPVLRPLIYGHLYRIIQECLNNARLHAGACRCFLKIREEGQVLFLDYHDDGAGFDVEKPAANERFGLRGMEYRVRLLGGKITIDSKGGNGTVIAVSIPLKNDQ